MFWETRATNSWTLQIHLFTSHSLSSTWSTSTRSKPWPYAMMLRTLTSQFGALWDTSMLSPVELWIAGSLALLCFWYVVGQKKFPQIPPNTHRYTAEVVSETYGCPPSPINHTFTMVGCKETPMIIDVEHLGAHWIFTTIIFSNGGW